MINKLVVPIALMLPIALSTGCGMETGGTGSSQPTSGVTLSEALGLNTYNYWNQYFESQFAPTLQLTLPLHASVVRTPIMWSDFAASPDPTPFWARFQQFVASLPVGVHPLFVAELIKPGVSPWPTAPADVASYTSFVLAIYQHLGNVDVEIGNEPNLATTDQGLIPSYANLVIAVAKAKRSAGLPGRIIAPAVSTYANPLDPVAHGGIPFLTFLNVCLAAGMGPYTDCFSIHIYGVTSDEAFEDMLLSYPGSRDLLGQFISAIGSKPFIVSEIGVSTYLGSQTDQSSKIIRSFLCCMARGAQGVDIYEARDRDWCVGETDLPCTPVSAFQATYGIVNTDYSPKQAYTDLQKLMNQFGDYIVTGITTGDGIHFTLTLVHGTTTAKVRWSATSAGANTTYPYDPVDSF